MSSFGETLRKERELRGVSLREIADATKISVRFLDALERDRLDVLPGGIFRRAFVRQYANHLGLDADRLVDEFLHFHPQESAPPPPPPAPPVRDRAHPGGAFLFVLAGLAAALSLMKLAGSEQAVRDAPVVAPPPPSISTGAGDQVYPPPVSPRATPVVEPEGLVLTMSASQECWVEVSVDGMTVMNRVMNEGESETLEAQGEIVLSVGNAGGLRFSINDHQGLPLGDSGEVRRNIRITRQSLAKLLEDPAAFEFSTSS